MSTQKRALIVSSLIVHRPTFSFILQKNQKTSPNQPKFLDKWALPYTELEFGERVQQGQIRIIRENLDLEISPYKLLLTGMNPHNYFSEFHSDNLKSMCMNLTYLFELKTKNPKIWENSKNFKILNFFEHNKDHEFYKQALNEQNSMPELLTILDYFEFNIKIDLADFTEHNQQ
jgi:ADP-ribose pyrophosphatase YjhB (NUDIX family)